MSQISKRMPWDKKVGMIRKDYYAGAMNRIKKAKENGLFIEQIALYESLLCDRLEARLQFLLSDNTGILNFKTIASAIKNLKIHEKQNNHKLFQIYDDILIWNRSRNKPIHEAVKISTEEKFEPFRERYSKYENIADKGAELFKNLTAEYNKIKRHNLRKQKENKQILNFKS